MEKINRGLKGITQFFFLLVVILFLGIMALVLLGSNVVLRQANAAIFYLVTMEVKVNGFAKEGFNVYLDEDENATLDFDLELVYLEGKYQANAISGFYYLYVFYEGDQIIEEDYLEVNSPISHGVELYDLGNGLTEQTPSVDWGIGSANISWYTTNPSASEFHISSGAELAGLAAIVNKGAGVLYYDELGILRESGNYIELTTPESFSGDKIYIDNELYLGEYRWIPVGALPYVFEGTLEGQNNIVKGLYICSPDSLVPVGLFSATPGELSRIILDKGYIQGKNNVGAFAGGYTGQLVNSVNNGVNIIGTSCLGGLVGVLSGEGKITRSNNYAQISGDGNIGGLTGIAGSDSLIIESKNYGDLQGIDITIGGIVGENQGYVSGCSSEGKIDGLSYLGGIVGNNMSSGVVINSYNKGEITGSSFIGGIAGAHQTGARLDNSYNLGTIEGTENVGGIAGRINFNVNNCFNGGIIPVGDAIGNESGDYISYCYYLSEENTTEEQNTKRNAFAYVSGSYRINAFEQYLIYSQIVTSDDTTLLSDALADWADSEGTEYISWKESGEYPVFLAKFSVEFSPVQGCAFAPYSGSSSPVVEGGSFSFIITLLPGYSNSIVTVRANDTLLFREGGIYTVNAITEEIIITVEGLSPNQYMVKFVSGNDVLSERYDCLYGEIPEIPADPEKASSETLNYTFTGWDKEILPVSSDITFYAVYEESTRYYSVIFLSDGLTISEKFDCLYGEEIIVPATPVKDAGPMYYYEFLSWDSEVANVYSDKQYNAIFTAYYVEYIVRFFNEGEVIAEKNDAHYGDTIVFPDNPIKLQDNTYTYQFAGWDKAVSIVESSIDFHARFNAIYRDYTVTFLSEGNILASDLYHFGDEILPPEPTKESDNQYNYVFTGWNEEIVPVNGNKTYSAIFNRIERQYSIIFSEGEEIFSSFSLPYGAEITLPDNPVKEADSEYEYTFSRWDPEVLEVTSDMVYIPIFDRNYRLYSVEFRKDDIVVSRRMSYRFNEVLEYPPPVTKESDENNAYEFIGWDSEASSVSENMIISAVFAPRPLVVYPRLDDNSDIVISASIEGGFNQGTVILGRKINSSLIDFSSVIGPGEELNSLYNASLMNGEVTIIGDIGNYTISLGAGEIEEGKTVKIVVFEGGELISYYTEVTNGIIVFPMTGTGDFAVIIESEFIEYGAISSWIYIVSFGGLALILAIEWLLLGQKPRKKQDNNYD